HGNVPASPAVGRLRDTQRHDRCARRGHGAVVSRLDRSDEYDQHVPRMGTPWIERTSAAGIAITGSGRRAPAGGSTVKRYRPKTLGKSPMVDGSFLPTLMAQESESMRGRHDHSRYWNSVTRSYCPA